MTVPEVNVVHSDPAQKLVKPLSSNNIKKKCTEVSITFARASKTCEHGLTRSKVCGSKVDGTTI
jgi:hypothetical protein